MKNLILEKLAALETERGIRILYGAESGSRAWGFASPNSDFDARFIYVYPKDRYLSLQTPPETIDLGVDENELDLTGWELRKTLRLLKSSNASPFEWLQSPILYKNDNEFREQLWKLSQSYFRPKNTAFHYLGLAKSSLAKGLVNHQMDIKKYFYVLRPLLAAIWICDKNTIPPMEFAPLLNQLKNKSELYVAIQDLVQQKIAAQEGDFIAPIPIIQTFIQEQIEIYQEKAKGLSGFPNEETALDNFFRNKLEV